MNWRRILSSWQGLLSGVLAVVIYLASPVVIRAVDPTAGVFDAGFLQWVLLAMVIYFLGIFVVWVGWQVAFRSMDRWADDQLLEAWETSFNSKQKWKYVQITFVIMLAYWVAVLFAAPR